MSYLTNSERVILAHEAGENITVAEASAINKLLDTIRSPNLRIVLAEQICEEYGWYQDADPEHLEHTGSTLVRCANIALGKGK